jgi:hypothetical protein
LEQFLLDVVTIQFVNYLIYDIPTDLHKNINNKHYYKSVIMLSGDGVFEKSGA